MSEASNHAARPARVFTVPPGEPFLSALARAVLAGGFPAPSVEPPDALSLARWTVFLPTRRASRALGAAFLDAGGGTARLLPRIRALGDPDEDELLWPLAEEEAGGLDLPPAIPPLKRLFLLSGLIRDWAVEQPRGRLSEALIASPAQVVALARSLASLIDSCETERTTLAALDAFLHEELPGHQAAALDFLDILRVKLPELIEGQGFIGPVERRNRLMAETERRLGQASAPVIAAGSTGSIPATADLLATVARLELGAVVLPGLDLDLDEESWAQLPPQHPQFGMAELLKRMGVERGDVRLLPGTNPATAPRAWLASELMRPAMTTHRWHENFAGKAEMVRRALDGVEAIEAADEREEALAIALRMREALETPGRTAALVTPDRALARRVRAELKRWEVAIDDSAGEPLIRLPGGTFLSLIAAAAAHNFGARTLMALLDHPYARLGRERRTVLAGARAVEVALYRSRRPSPAPERLQDALAEARARVDPYAHPALKRLRASDWQAAEDLCAGLLESFAPLLRLFDERETSLSALLRAHLETAEALGRGAPLWRGEEGEALSGLIAGLVEEAPHCPLLKPGDYPALIDSFLAATAVRPAHGRHPRLSILGLLEARMTEADLTVLAGLNEGVWPGQADTGPWLNRPQFRKMGLPSPERRIGLSAHDFAQGFARPRVVLAWSRKRGASPAVPSRWIMRLEALRAAAGLVEERESIPCGWARALDRPDEVRPVQRPRVAPPMALRPKELSVTRVEELLGDPYATFARYVLALRSLDPLGEPAGYLELGNIVHRMVQKFISQHAGPLTDDALDTLMREAEQAFDDFGIDPAQRTFWRPRMRRIGRWFIELETTLGAEASEHFVENTGRCALRIGAEDFRLTARADRIDRLVGGGLRILDYKTGTLPSFDPAARIFSPQLLLEALIAREGGFEALDAAEPSDLAYVRLSGGTPAGEYKRLKKDVAAAVDAAAEGLRSLLAAYADPAFPYEARDWSDDPRKERDFGHLSRWREWSTSDEEDPV